MCETQDYREYFNSKESAEEYDEKSYLEGTYMAELWKIEKSILHDFLVSLKSKGGKTKYLDFACGTGRITAVVEDLVDESYGLDISQAMLDRAAANTRKTKLITGDLTRDKDILPGKFDLITAFRFVLNAQPELRENALKILSDKMVSSDSWLIFNMHCNKYSYAFFSYLWYRFFKKENGDTRNYLTRRDCIRIANDAGLDVVKIKGIGYFSRKLFSIFPSSLVLFAEKMFSKIPYFNRFGCDLIVFCKKKKAVDKTLTEI
jgi:SAM-dependent methyltransferase